MTPLENPAVNGPWICNKGRDLAQIFERPRALQPMRRASRSSSGRAIDAARELIDGAKHPVALVSSWGSNEELAAFKHALGARFDALREAGLRCRAGRAGRGRPADPRRQESEHAPARARCSGVPTTAPAASPTGTDLVLVWGEGFDFARAPARREDRSSSTRICSPRTAHADVFLPISIQTERRGHYTNFEGVVERVRAVLRRSRRRCADAEALFAALAHGAREGGRPRMIQDLVVYAGVHRLRGRACC